MGENIIIKDIQRKMASWWKIFGSTSSMECIIHDDNLIEKDEEEAESSVNMNLVKCSYPGDLFGDFGFFDSVYASVCEGQRPILGVSLNPSYLIVLEIGSLTELRTL